MRQNLISIIIKVSNNESKGKGKRDSSQAEKPAKLEAEAESSVVSNKKADDSLVNITV